MGVNLKKVNIHLEFVTERNLGAVVTLFEAIGYCCF